MPNAISALAVLHARIPSDGQIGGAGQPWEKDTSLDGKKLCDDRHGSLRPLARGEGRCAKPVINRAILRHLALSQRGFRLSARARGLRSLREQPRGKSGWRSSPNGRSPDSLPGRSVQVIADYVFCARPIDILSCPSINRVAVLDAGSVAGGGDRVSGDARLAHSGGSVGLRSHKEQPVIQRRRAMLKRCRGPRGPLQASPRHVGNIEGRRNEGFWQDPRDIEGLVCS